MFIKPSTILASAIFALLQNPRSPQQKQWLFLVAVVATVVIYGMFRGISIQNRPEQSPVTIQGRCHSAESTTLKWSYDEMAHKLIMENTDLTCEEISRGFSKGIGHALIKITRQIDARPVIVNM